MSSKGMCASVLFKIVLLVSLAVGVGDLYADDPCPAPGHLGIFSEADYYDTFTRHLGRDIDLCADLTFQGSAPQIRDGFRDFEADPTEYALGYSGTFDGRGHTIRTAVNSNAVQQRGVGLDFRDLFGTIKNLTLENPVDVSAVPASGYLIAWDAHGAVLRNITLKNVSTSAGLVLEGSNLIFDQLRGDVHIRIGDPQRYAGGLAYHCGNCEFSNLDLSINLLRAEQRYLSANSNGQVIYAGGLVGYSGLTGGFIKVRDSVLRGGLQLGYDRGMIVGAMERGSLMAADGSMPPAELVVTNVKILGADLTQPATHRSYTVGAIGGRVSVPMVLSRVLIRDSQIEGTIQAGAIAGGAYQSSLTEVAADNVSIKAGQIAGGLLGYGHSTRIEDSYFRGSVIQDTPFSGGGVGSTLFGAGGLIGLNYGDIDLARAYSKAQVSATDPSVLGALFGGGDSSSGFAVNVENAYYDSDLVAQSTVGSPLTSAQMVDPASFVGFDPTVWRLQLSRLPTLQHVPVFFLQDLFDFLQFYFARDLRADVNGDGIVSISDVLRFIELYFGN